MQQRRGTWRFWAVLALAAALCWTGDPARADKLEKRVEELPREYREWVGDVRLLMSPDELKEFLALEKDYQRDAFIEAFWAARDPYPETQRNEYREAWESRLRFVEEEYPEIYDERRDLLLLNGEPSIRQEFPCTPGIVSPVEVWGYSESDRMDHEFYLIFRQPDGVGPYRLYDPRDGLHVFFPEPAYSLENRCKQLGRTRTEGPGEQPRTTDPAPNLRPLSVEDDLSYECATALLGRHCDLGNRDSLLLIALARLRLEERIFSFDVLEARLKSRPDPEESEWLATFQAYSTDLPEGASTFPAELTIDFPGRRQSRTVVAGIFAVPASDLATVELAGERSYDLVLLGEVLREQELLETFRYEIHVPTREDVEARATSEAVVPVTFQRALRPGDYRLVMKLEDIHSGKLHRVEREIEVPHVEASWVPPEAEDPVAESLLAEAVARLGGGEDPELRLVPPGDGPHTGMVRFDTVGSPTGVDRVRFFLNGEPVMSRNRPPYGVELDLGPIPRLHTVRLVAYGEDGEAVASDELEINAGVHSFRVRLLEPHSERTYAGSAPVRAEIQVPKDQALDRLEIWVGETRHATLYQEPFEQRVPLPGGPTYVRAVAWLTDGSQMEDMAWVNAPGVFEEVDVDLVEVYAAVTAAGRMLDGLTQDDFTVLENGEPQEIQRFERVENRPLWIMALFDTSASMEGRLDETRHAAMGFFEQVLTPKDRAALLAFHDRPRLRADFTHDVTDLAVELASLKAERGTALYDAVITGLYAMNGLQGQRAMLLLSDGKDESSRRTYQEALDYAKTAGVTIYSIGLDFKKTDLEARRHLNKLAEQTGGRSFYVQSPEELAEVYEQIERELRSRYLLVYASTHEGDDFRTVEVRVDRPGAEVQAMRGYFP